MLFQHTITGKTYVVRAGDPTYNTRGLPVPGTGPSPLRAKFTGSQRMFDSLAAQDEHNWSDEERVAVEAFLIGHADFYAVASASGPGAQSRIYLSHGQQVPGEHAEVYAKAMKRLEAYGMPTTPVQGVELPPPPLRCMAFSEGPEGLVRCPKLAEPGSDLCEQEHTSEVAVSA